MRAVDQSSAVWRNCGVAATDAAALVGCGAEDRENPLTKWSDKTWIRERPLRKQAELEQGTPAWLEDRKKGLGGSEVAVVVGASYDYGGKTSPLKTWDEKTKPVRGEAENANMQRGKRLEPKARELYEALYDWSVPPLCVVHDDHDCIRCSLDGLRGDDRLVVEIKACGATNHNKLLQVQSVADPLERQRLFARYFPYYRPQVLYQLLITGADICHFVGFNEEFADHNRLAVIELYQEPEAQAELLRRSLEFWGFVERREPPDLEWCCYQWAPPSELKLPPAVVP